MMCRLLIMLRICFIVKLIFGIIDYMMKSFLGKEIYDTR